VKFKFPFMKVMIVIEDTVQAERGVSFYAEQLHAPDSEVVLVGLSSPPSRWASLNPSEQLDAGLKKSRVQIALNLAWQRLQAIGATYKTHVAHGEFVDTILQIAAAEGCGHVIVPPRANHDRAASFFDRKSAGRINLLVQQSAVPITVLAHQQADDQNSSKVSKLDRIR
jgi:hypothetical protein